MSLDILFKNRQTLVTEVKRLKIAIIKNKNDLEQLNNEVKFLNEELEDNLLEFHELAENSIKED